MVEFFSSIIARILPEPQAGLLTGILFGTRASLPKDLYAALIETGTVHLIALSGMNISLLIGMIGYLTRPMGKRWSAVVTIGGIGGFILVVGASPSIVRAGIMGILSLLAILFGRQYWGLFSLFLTGICMVIFSPLLLWDVSFQLSFLATLGVLLAQWRSKLADSWWDELKETFRLTIYAQVCTLPVMVFVFHRISLISPFANVLVEWAVQPIMVVGFFMILLGAVWLPLAYIPGWIAYVLVSYVIWIVQWMSQIPGGQLAW